MSAFVLLLVAAVSGLVAVVGTSQLDGGYLAPTSGASGDDLFVDPVEVEGEVLDVDGGPDEGWASVDVAHPDGLGGTEVSSVDLGPVEAGGAVPAVGERIDLVHERGDPSWVLRADAPALDPSVGTTDLDADPVSTREQRAATEAVVRRCGALAA